MPGDNARGRVDRPRDRLTWLCSGPSPSGLRYGLAWLSATNHLLGCSLSVPCAPYLWHASVSSDRCAQDRSQAKPD
jgi:hypothetical protein